jgi:hypothetical protein
MIDSINNFQAPQYLADTRAPQKSKQEQMKETHLPNSEDTVKISSEGRQQLKAAAGQPSGMSGEEKLTAEQQQEADKLKQTDQEVKAHERAHMAAGSGVVMGGASYQYQRGPDGKMYAVGGEVKIDTSRERDPQDTIRKMQQVKRAALAPAQPSGQDRSVAARAFQIEAEARIELLKEREEEAKKEKAKQEESTGETRTGKISIPHHNAYNSAHTDPSINIVI